MHCLVAVAALFATSQARPELPYRELVGKAEGFRYIRQWRFYYWREDFTFVLKTDDGKSVRVISREPTPWTGHRLGTTFTGLKVDWDKNPRVRVIGVGGVDRTPVDFHDLKLDPAGTVTAFLVRDETRPKEPRDYFINNWFHPWSKEADARMLAHFAGGGPAYTVYGFLNSKPAPLDSAGEAVLKKLGDDYNGIIYHARVVKADNPAGHELKLLHLMGRHKKKLDYRVFHGDPKTLIKLDQVPPPKEKPKRFTDATAASGLKVAKGCKPHAVGVADLDGDGRADVLIATFDAPHVYLFRNKGGLKFADITKGSGLEAFDGTGAGVAIADFDGDGKPDVYIASVRGGASRLFRNLGGGKFVDVSVKSGTLLKDAARSCAWSDVDGDGRPDLFVCCPDKGNRLFRNNGDSTFTDIADKAGVALKGRHCLGCAFGDFDGSGRDGLFVTCYKSQSSALYRNLGGGKFKDVTAEAGLGRGASSVGCVFADVFNRGRLDLYVTTDSWLSGANYTEAQLLAQRHTVEPNVLYANDGKGRFKPVADKALDLKTLGHDALIEDLDHDGRPDIYCTVDAESGNKWATSKGGDRIWTRRGEAWEEVGAAWGVKHEANSVCVVAADLDGDGDLDLLLVNFYSPPVLLRNNTDDANWLIVRAPLGSKVRVGGAMRHIQSGAGYARCSPMEAHFGLGPKPAAACTVEVTFPGGKKAVEKGVRPGRVVVVKGPG